MTDDYIECEGREGSWRSCRREAKHHLCDDHLEEKLEEERDKILPIADWLTGDDTGASSIFLARCLLGLKDGDVRYPHDPGDFGRCYRLSEIVTTKELEAGLLIAAKRCAHWGAIAKHWLELVALFNEECKLATGRAPRLYQRMKDLGL